MILDESYRLSSIDRRWPPRSLSGLFDSSANAICQLGAYPWLASKSSSGPNSRCGRHFDPIPSGLDGCTLFSLPLLGRRDPTLERERCYDDQMLSA